MIFINNNRSQFQENKSWKQKSNTIIVSKNINNSTNSVNVNNIESMVWPENCEFKNKYNFKANPLKHYRKQYTVANSFSNSSMIGFLDKPGNYIVTDSSNCKTCGNMNSQNINIHILQDNDKYPQTGDWSYDSSLKKMVCTACNPQSLVIKRANTNLDDKYCASNKEYLYRRCKTFDQNNLQTQPDINCNNHMFSCNPVIHFTNKNYQTTGPITSSSRITALKYGCTNANNRRCLIRKTDFNDNNLCGTLTNEECKNRKQALQNISCTGCINDNKIRRKRINILK